jgi:hypothetical protein
MKHAFVLILIVPLVFLAKSVNGSPPAESPQLPSYSAGYGKEHPQPVQAAKPIEKKPHQNKSDDQRSATERQSVPMSEFSAVFGKLFTVLLVIGTFLQARYVYLTHIGNRPYIIIDQFSLKNVIPRSKAPDDGFTVMACRCRIRNVGKGPATIKTAKGLIKVLDIEMGGLIPSLCEFGNLGDCRPLPISDSVIASEGTSEAASAFPGILLTDEQYKKIVMTYEQTLGFYGLIEYKGVTRKKYRTAFGMAYRPKKMLGDEDGFFRGLDKYNYNK